MTFPFLSPLKPLLALAALALCGNAHAQSATTSPTGEIPVPAIETALSPLPTPDALPVQPDLPDVLIADDGTKIATPGQWLGRRAKIKSTLEWYATGAIPPPPNNVRSRELKSATYLDGTVSYRLIHLSFGPGEKLGFDVALFIPTKGAGPFPTIVFPTFDPTPGAEKLPLLPRPPGQGKGVNALLPADAYVPPKDSPPTNAPAATTSPQPDKNDPAIVAASHRELFDRGYALATYHYQDTGEDTTLRLSDGSWSYRTTRYYSAYPSYDWGLAAGWAWGISRVIDFLQAESFADKTKIIATGHSRLGKAVLIAGAFDERISLSAPAGSGAGGTAAYRFTGAGRGGKEGLDDMMRKYPNWFSPHLHPFRGEVEKLPFDQHWFIALTAPRAFISLEGSEDQNCVPNAVRQSLAGALPVYSIFNAATKAGVNYAPHKHGYADDDWTALLDFADQQLLGKPVSRRFDQFPAEPAAGVPDQPSAR